VGWWGQSKGVAIVHREHRILQLGFGLQQLFVKLTTAFLDHHFFRSWNIGREGAAAK